ncbi:MAG TPA: ABC transporter ATP-binding protein [Anaeromyxobacteraceae bacterium]|nr:ABC transporter ATP-binding protein [Anaeromyxobacteraceae bacterium]
MIALELLGVSKVRGDGRMAVRALREVSLRVEPGELALLEGPSGSGKTTLLAVAAGLLRPDAGEVRIGGQALPLDDVEARRRLRARSVGFVFQRSNLLPGLGALENVLVQAALAGIEAGEAERRARELLVALGVAHLAGRLTGGLSAGEEQRFAVARGLVHAPLVVLADEPTASLDGTAGRSVVELLLALGRERGAGILVATHDHRLAPFATRRLRLADGHLEAGSGAS